MLRTFARLPIRITRRLLRITRRVVAGGPPAAPQTAPDPAPAPAAAPAPTSPAAAPVPASPVAPPVPLRVDVTPNPHALKFTAPFPVVAKGSLSFNSVTSASNHPIGRALFSIEGVKLVFAVHDFVTVTKHDDATWESLRSRIEVALGEALSAPGVRG